MSTEDNATHSKDNKSVGTDKDYPFNYDLTAAPLGKKLQLLTSGGIAIQGQITRADLEGKSAIWAWALLPTRNKAEEERRGLGSNYKPKE